MCPDVNSVTDIKLVLKVVILMVDLIQNKSLCFTVHVRTRSHAFVDFWRTVASAHTCPHVVPPSYFYMHVYTGT